MLGGANAFGFLESLSQFPMVAVVVIADAYCVNRFVVKKRVDRRKMT